MDARQLEVVVVDPELSPGAAMWGDATGAPASAAARWLGPLLAAGVAVTAVDDPARDPGRGLLVDPSGELAGTAAPGRPVVTGPPPPSPGGVLDACASALGALVRPDLRGALVLRLDDPGASVRRHLEGWAHDDVEPAAWRALGDALAGFGRASAFCCSEWVGTDGTIRPSREAAPEWPHLEALVAAGVLDLECHGATHLHPDLGAWLAASDRATDARWYRELWPPAEAVEPDVAAQAAILARWQAACGTGTTLVAPGEAWGTGTVAAARRRGFHLFASWEVCRLQEHAAPAWTVGVGSPYLDEAASGWFDDGLPTVGYWHDRDLAVHGPRWFGDQLASWRDVGARRGLAFADLDRAWRSVPPCRLDRRGRVAVEGPVGWPLLVQRPGGELVPLT